MFKKTVGKSCWVASYQFFEHQWLWKAGFQLNIPIPWMYLFFFIVFEIYVFIAK